MPRLEKQLRSGWLAWAIASLSLSPQHATLPLILDVRFVLRRALMGLPSTFYIGAILKAPPRLLPFLVIGHALIDFATVAVYFTLAWPGSAAPRRLLPSCAVQLARPTPGMGDASRAPETHGLRLSSVFPDNPIGCSRALRVWVPTATSRWKRCLMERTVSLTVRGRVRPSGNWPSATGQARYGGPRLRPGRSFSKQRRQA